MCHNLGPKAMSHNRGPIALGSCDDITPNDMVRIRNVLNAHDRARSNLLIRLHDIGFIGCFNYDYNRYNADHPGIYIYYPTLDGNRVIRVGSL